MLPRILILYTGGTFGMDIHPSKGKGTTLLSIPHLSPALLKKRLEDRVPELQSLARCHVDIVMNRDSAHIGPQEWVSLAHQIQREWKKYDGIVLLHGTDTLAYTASALSFLLRPCLKPIVMTGAQRPLSANRTDARTNLISAVEIAASGPRKTVNQVTVFFGDKLFQGNRVRKKSASDFTAFDSPRFSPLAVVGTTIRYQDSVLKQRLAKTLKLQPAFSPNVMLAHVTPAFPAQAITRQLLPVIDGLVLVIFHSGTAPTHDPAFIELLQTAKKMKIPITLATEGSSQPPNSIHNLSVQYTAGQELLSEGCFWAGSMTPECAFVKTSLILGQSKDIRKFARLWNQDFAGEGD